MDLDPNAHLIRILGTIFAGLLGLAFGSFLNVCLSRWPAGESIVKPGSHCRNCDHTLAWWENIPLLSWLALRGRCRKCHTPISWRYPMVELAVSASWAAQFWCLTENISSPLLSTAAQPQISFPYLFLPIGMMWTLCWLLVALAALDAENLWLPDWLTLPGATLGLLLFLIRIKLNSNLVLAYYGALGLENRLLFRLTSRRVMGILAAAALILIIRWLYKLIRHQEGLGLGDAKLMALLAAWLGLPGALLSFFLGAILGSLAALVLLTVPAARRDSESWSNSKLPLGTFLCIGGIVSSLWGQQITAAYRLWAGF